MIEFMVIALPRSGTTWASNWLTTDTTHCLHDPLYEHHYRNWDSIPSRKVLGVSCTGAYNFSDWVRSHPARKVILHRSLTEINRSLDAIGAPKLSAGDERKLNAIEGLHVDWQDLFCDPVEIYEYLVQKPFDGERHAALARIEMQPQFSGLTINRGVTRQLLDKLRSM